MRELAFAGLSNQSPLGRPSFPGGRQPAVGEQCGIKSLFKYPGWLGLEMGGESREKQRTEGNSFGNGFHVGPGVRISVGESGLLQVEQ